MCKKYVDFIRKGLYFEEGQGRLLLIRLSMRGNVLQRCICYESPVYTESE